MISICANWKSPGKFKLDTKTNAGKVNGKGTRTAYRQYHYDALIIVVGVETLDDPTIYVLPKKFLRDERVFRTEEHSGKQAVYVYPPAEGLNPEASSPTYGHWNKYIVCPNNDEKRVKEILREAFGEPGEHEDP